jgi:hypothetical protein
MAVSHLVPYVPPEVAIAAAAAIPAAIFQQQFYY